MSEESDFGNAEPDRLKYSIDQQFESAYLHAPEQAEHATMVAASATEEAICMLGDRLHPGFGSIQASFKKIAFLFNDPSDALESADLAPVFLGRHIKNGGDLDQTAGQLEAHAGEMLVLLMRVTESAGDIYWQQYSSRQRLWFAEGVVAAHVRPADGGSDVD